MDAALPQPGRLVVSETIDSVADTAGPRKIAVLTRIPMWGFGRATAWQSRNAPWEKSWGGLAKRSPPPLRTLLPTGTSLGHLHPQFHRPNHLYGRRATTWLRDPGISCCAEIAGSANDLIVVSQNPVSNSFQYCR